MTKKADPGPIFMNPAAEEGTWRSLAGQGLHLRIFGALVDLLVEGFLGGLPMFTRPTPVVAFLSVLQKLFQCYSYQ